MWLIFASNEMWQNFTVTIFWSIRVNFRYDSVISKYGLLTGRDFCFMMKVVWYFTRQKGFRDWFIGNIWDIYFCCLIVVLLG